MKHFQIWRYLAANSGKEVKMRHIIGACFPPLTAKQRATVTQSVRAVLRKLEKRGQVAVRREGANVFFYRWIGRMVVHKSEDPE
jgi:hypothetical protein